MSDDRPLLEVLFDAEKVPAKHAEAILKEVSGIGELALRRVYSDWASDPLCGWAKVIPELGLVARQETANTSRKNASDIGLMIDAMDILHGGNFRGFLIVAPDSDFTALANRLREDGLDVIGIGEAKTPQSLRNVCNRFILIENISGEAAKTDPVDTASNKKAVSKSPKPLHLFKTALDNLESEDGWYNLWPVGSRIMAAHPNFDPRSYGHSKLSAMVKTLNGLETKQSGTHLMIRLKS
jgi:uncharacterized LabA/DUF88 family protein